jgi:predicted ArsR family transcriptional regulator
MARLTKDQRMYVKQAVLNQLNPAVPQSTLQVAKKLGRSWLLVKKTLDELEKEGNVKKFSTATEKKTLEYWSPA